MYVPPAFVETDLARLHDFMEQYSFGLLVAQGNELVGSHLPLLLDRTAGDHGRLIGHMARANPQWQSASGTEVLVVFSGPHAYITPTWYAAEKVVPTWNYVAVHAYGTFRLVDDEQETIKIVYDTVEHYERSRPQPWTLENDDEFIRRLVAQVVGFTIDLQRIEGKWKLSQNHAVERQERVVQGLQESPRHEDHQLAQLMRESIQRGGQQE